MILGHMRIFERKDTNIENIFKKIFNT